jgi:hypothetical protein
MRYSNTAMTDNLFLALLFGAVATTAACSSGSDSPTPGAGGSTAGVGGSANTGGAGGTANTGGSTAQSTGGAVNTGGSTGAGGSTSAGGSTGGGGATISPSSVCYNATKALDALADTFVDDFEEADGKVLPGWYAFNDTTPANSIKPTIDADGAATTAHSLHYTGTGIKSPTNGGFGAGLVWGLLPASTNCVDVSAFDGVTFWAKLGTAATANTKVYFKVATPETNASKALEATGIGDCAGPTGCYNPPNKIITLTSTWTQYAVKWSDLTGGSLPGSKKPTWVNLAQQLVWTSDGPDFDLSIDEVAFYKGTAPTGPVKQ